MTPTTAPTPTPLALMQTALGKLNTQELQALKSSIDLRLRVQFRHGAVVQFKGRHGEQVTMRIDRINDKTLGGVQIGGMRPGTKWRVAPQLCTLVSAS